MWGLAFIAFLVGFCAGGAVTATAVIWWLQAGLREPLNVFSDAELDQAVER